MFPNGYALFPTEQRLYDILRDGKSHTVTELMTCLYDTMGNVNNLNQHLSSLRQKVRRYGIGLRLERVEKVTSYSFVRLLPPSDE